MDFAYRILTPFINIPRYILIYLISYSHLINYECLNRITIHLIEALLIDDDFFKKDYKYFTIVKVQLNIL